MYCMLMCKMRYGIVIDNHKHVVDDLIIIMVIKGVVVIDMIMIVIEYDL